MALHTGLVLIRMEGRGLGMTCLTSYTTSLPLSLVRWCVYNYLRRTPLLWSNLQLIARKVINVNSILAGKINLFSWLSATRLPPEKWLMVMAFLLLKMAAWLSCSFYMQTQNMEDLLAIMAETLSIATNKLVELFILTKFTITF